MRRSAQNRAMLALEAVAVFALAYWIWDARERMETRETVLLVAVVLILAVSSVIYFRSTRVTTVEPAHHPDGDAEE